MTLERMALGAFGLSVMAVLAAVSFGATNIVIASYFTGIAGGLLFGSVALWAAHRASLERPPLHMMVWMFLHLSVWAFTYAGEQSGWYMWRMQQIAFGGEPFASEGFARFFEIRISPLLKITQGACLAGLLCVSWFFLTGVPPAHFRRLILTAWALVIGGSAIVLVATRLAL